MRRILFTLSLALALPSAGKCGFIGVRVLGTDVTGHIEAQVTQDGRLVWLKIIDLPGIPTAYPKVQNGDLLVLGGSAEVGWTALRTDGAVWRLEPYTPTR